MTQPELDWRLDRGRRLVVALLAGSLTVGVGVADAASGEGSGGISPDELVDGKTETDGGGTSGDGSGGGEIEVRMAEVAPEKAFFIRRKALLRYEIAGDRRRDIVVQVQHRRTGKIVRRFRRNDVEPRTTASVRWNGIKDNNGLSKNGRYRFRIKGADGQPVDATAARGDRRFKFYRDRFPVRGRHTYGDGIGAGRGHRGQDVFAACGTRLAAARGGRVQWKAYQGSGAGYYVVIDGRKTERDYVYMHLRGPATVREGERVRTGEKIGEVGQSGNASGCHLHFELWRGGWYESGGTFIDPTPHLKAWDSWS